jgi:hypothetical protein
MRRCDKNGDGRITEEEVKEVRWIDINSAFMACFSFQLDKPEHLSLILDFLRSLH